MGVSTMLAPLEPRTRLECLLFKQQVGGTYWNAVAPTGMLLFHPSGSRIQQMDDNIWGVVKFGLH